MNIISIIKSVIISMSVNKLRTVLTILGMVIGISSVIIVYSAGAGIESLILNEIETFGTDIIETEIKIPTGKKSTGASETQNASAIAMGVQVTSLKTEDMKDINKLSNIIDSYAGVMSQEKVSYGNETRIAIIFGTNAGYVDIDKSEVEFGRFFTDAEDRSLSKVVVLGSKMKEKLFGDNEAIGKTIKLRKTKFKVIGIMKERGAVMTMSFDDYVYVPIRTLQKEVMGIDHVTYMVHKVKDMETAEETAEEIRTILRENHDIVPLGVDDLGRPDLGKDDFRVTTMDEMMDMMGIITNAITLLLLAIVAVSLLVGGVGIMNIMYVAVRERSPEIGLRKAVGATYNDIMRQFLVESIFITLIGGVVGVSLGILISYIIAVSASYAGLDWSFSIPLISFVVSIGFSCFFGLVFGLYPARQAARLNPIEAMRKE
ncbi:MAG: ABC transporter permease [bacterium]